MPILKSLIKKAKPITVHTSRLDDGHMRITTRRGHEIRETTAVVFTESEVTHIDRAREAVEEKESKLAPTE